MKTPQWLLLLMALGVALLAGGCASVTGNDYAGDLYYYDVGYVWWWGAGSGWRYEGFHGRGVAGEPGRHHPPPPGSLPHHEPGLPAPCYFLLAKDGSVRASLDGKSFRDVTAIAGPSFVLALSGLNNLHLPLYAGGGKVPALRNSAHPASVPTGAVQRILSRTAALFSTSSANHLGWNSTAGGSSRSSSNSSWGGRSFLGSGFNSGGSNGGGGSSHFSGGGGGGGGGWGGGGHGGGGGGGGGHGGGGGGGGGHEH